MNRQNVEAVCECLRQKTKQMLKIRPINPYFSATYYKPSDVGKTTFEGLNIINIITGGRYE